MDLNVVEENVDEVRDWLALWRVQGLGAATFARLLAAFPDVGQVFKASGAALRELGVGEAVLAGLKAPDWKAAESDLRWLEAQDHHLVRLSDAAYPQRLARLDTPPPLLFVVGDPEVLAHPQLAIVGARTPTPGGVDNAERFAEHLAGMGLGITSGLAAGIDAAAHRGALAADGITVAVMGTGPDRIYPARNRDLAHQIAAQGALVTEFPPGSGVKADHFPRRNRIISGLSVGTLVVEAGLRSGSLITARYALEQGREVFAIPGSIHNPLAKGCHSLIRQGAKLVESARDVLEELPPLVEPPAAERSAETQAVAEPLDPEYEQVLEALGYDPTPVDLVVRRTGLTPAAVSSMLLVLELRGLVHAATGGRYARR